MDVEKAHEELDEANSQVAAPDKALDRQLKAETDHAAPDLAKHDAHKDGDLDGDLFQKIPMPCISAPRIGIAPGSMGLVPALNIESQKKVFASDTQNDWRPNNRTARVE